MTQNLLLAGFMFIVIFPILVHLDFEHIKEISSISERERDRVSKSARSGEKLNDIVA